MSGNDEGVVVGVGAHQFRCARRSFSNRYNPVSKTFVSVVWLVMPIHWIRDENTYIIHEWMSLDFL